MQIGFLGLLQLVFIVLKLTAVITWSWWLVLIPSYISITVVLLLLSPWLIILASNCFDYFKRKK